jgi:homoserine dehydrogenase
MAAPLKLGVAGLGNVGAALVALVARQRGELAVRCGRSIEVVAVSARARGKERGLDLKKLHWFADPVALARSGDIDVFVELIGGAGGPAKAAVEAALAAGKSVVTANKALLAAHGVKLAALAESKGVALDFEAAAAAAIPIVKTLRDGLAGNRVARLYGILNGTCNYILTKMEQERMPFSACLAEAQRLGYAEADPTFDIEGHDTAQKLAILASLAFGTKVDESAIYVEGISSITPADLSAADELGYRVKLLGVAVRTGKGIEQRVHPTMVRKDAAIAQVAPFGRPTARLAVVRKAPMQRHEGGYYIRLMARDRPGTAATIAKRLAEQDISLESIVQRHDPGEPAVNGKGRPVPVILITYATTEDAVRKALAAVGRDRVISDRPQVIRIEKN